MALLAILTGSVTRQCRFYKHMAASRSLAPYVLLTDQQAAARCRLYHPQLNPNMTTADLADHYLTVGRAEGWAHRCAGVPAGLKLTAGFRSGLLQ